MEGQRFIPASPFDDRILLIVENPDDTLDDEEGDEVVVRRVPRRVADFLAWREGGTERYSKTRNDSRRH
jgi:hypothetical protein